VNRTVFFALVSASLFSLLHAGGAPAPHPLLSVEVARYEAMIARDREALSRLLADDLIYVHSNGLRESKAAFIDAVENGDICYLGVETVETNIRDHGNWALLNGIVRMTVEIGGNRQSKSLHFTAVYRRIDRSWQLASWQTTRTM